MTFSIFFQIWNSKGSILGQELEKGYGRKNEKGVQLSNGILRSLVKP